MVNIAAYTKPLCQRFSNHDNKTTIIFTDDKAGEWYHVSDVIFIPHWLGKEYKATSVKVTVNHGVATVTLTFENTTTFSNPKVVLKINGKKTILKVLH